MSASYCETPFRAGKSKIGMQMEEQQPKEVQVLAQKSSCRVDGHLSVLRSTPTQCPPHLPDQTEVLCLSRCVFLMKFVSFSSSLPSWTSLGR